MRRVALGAALAGAAILVGAAAWWLVELAAYRAFLQRPYPTATGPIEATIPPGASLRRAAETLAKAGVVADADHFVRLARSRDAATRLQAGEYEFRAPILPARVLEMLVTGEVRVRTITVPEGFVAAQIADLVQAAGIAPRDDFLALVRSRETAAAHGVQADSLEGYLFPDTYRYTRQTTVEQIVATMVARFRSVFAGRMEERARERGVSVHEVVTLASIVEKETARPDERPLIASVFLNRLRRGIPLAADPTVIYGLSAFDGNLRAADLARPTPYNTYLNAGPPPGPICSPGAASLEAVLWPADTDFLYFVSRNDGSHEFNRGYAAHAAAVRRYQQRRARN